MDDVRRPPSWEESESPYLCDIVMLVYDGLTPGGKCDLGDQME